MISLYIPLLGLAVIFTALLLASYWSGMWSPPNPEAIAKELEHINTRVDNTHSVRELERLLVQVNVIMISYKQCGVLQCPRLNKKINNCHDRIAARIHSSRSQGRATCMGRH